MKRMRMNDKTKRTQMLHGVNKGRNRRNLGRARRRNEQAARGEGCSTAGWHWRRHGIHWALAMGMERKSPSEARSSRCVTFVRGEHLRACSCRDRSRRLLWRIELGFSVLSAHIASRHSPEAQPPRMLGFQEFFGPIDLTFSRTGPKSVVLS